MKEPLCARTARKEMAQEIKKSQEKLKSSVVYVTYGVDESFKLGHMVVVMNKGKIEQRDRPEDLIMQTRRHWV